MYDIPMYIMTRFYTSNLLKINKDYLIRIFIINMYIITYYTICVSGRYLNYQLILLNI